MRNIRVADRSEWVFEQQPEPAPPRRDGLRRRLATLPLLLLVPALALPFVAASAGTPDLAVSPQSASPGSIVAVRGSQFARSATGTLVLDEGVAIGSFRATGAGTFKSRITLPVAVSTGAHTVSAVDGETVLATAEIIVTEPTPAPTATPRATAKPKPSATPKPTPSATPKPSPAPTATPTPTTAPDDGPAATPTPAPSASSTPAPSTTPGPSPTATPESSTVGAFYVSSTGNDANDGSLASPWRTVGKAASSVPAGSTVFIRGGTYAPFTVTRSGLSGTPTRYVRYPGETVVIAGDGVRSTVVLVSGAHDIVIQGLVIQNAPNQWGAGVRVDNGAYRVSILANTIRNNRSFGVKLAGVTGISVKGNDIANNETGIEISGSGAGIVIDGNEIHDNDRMVVNTIGGNDDRGANGIVFYRTTGSILVTGNLIYNNRATSYDYGYDGGAFEIYAASNVEIRGNSVWNNENVMETGTDGTDCSDNLFVGNVAYGGAKTGPTMGMILRCARNMLVAHNSFYGLDRFVFDVNAQASAFGGSIDGLRILNNASVMTGAKIYSIDSAMPASVVIDHGVARETTGGSIAYVYGKGNTSSLATFTSWTGFEAAGLQGDPQFIGPDAGNFALAATSPAIDRGLVLIGVNDGYVGTAPDRGAREYRP